MRLLALMLLLAPLAAAGTAEDPDVLDPNGDSESSNPLLGAVGAELLNAWFQEDADNVHFTFEVGTLCADTAETIEYDWTTTTPGGDVVFGAETFGTGGFCTLAGSDTSITATGASTAATMTGNLANLVIPKAAFGGDGTVLSGTFGTSLAYVGSPLIWNDADRAPNEGGGRDYTIGGPGDVPEVGPLVHHINITDAVLIHETTADEPLNATYVLHWQGPGNVTFNATMVGNGTVTVEASGPDGAVHDVCTCAANEAYEALAMPGAWNITVEYANFEGNFRLTASEAASPADPANNETVESTSTESSEVAIEDEESPGLPVVVVGLALLLIARRK